MYSRYFGLTEAPFSIAPNPRYLYMSERHREALAHLLYGVSGSGGFVMLTGEVGTGKTTISRSLLQRLPDDTDIAFILNPYQTTLELLATICEELSLAYISDEPTLKELNDVLHHYLLDNHAKGRNTVLMIDEAQLLPFETLEQIRLLTNLETDNKKLLQIILIGQPELQQLLARPELRQLAQRITARFHIDVMPQQEVQHYIVHRLKVAGVESGEQLFSAKVCREIYRYSGGVPRLINVLCDRALLGAYTQHKLSVDSTTLRAAAREVLGKEALQHRPENSSQTSRAPWLVAGAATVAALAIALLWWSSLDEAVSKSVPATVAEVQALPNKGAKQVAQKSKPVSATAAEPVLVADNMASSSVPVSATNETIEAVPPVAAASVWQPELGSALTSLLGYSGLGSGFNVSDCASLSRHGLSCLAQPVKHWGAVKQINRPMILQRQGGESYAVLIGIEAGQAILLVDGKPKRMPLLSLGELWGGETLIVWRKPDSYQKPIGLGARGAMVSWLAKAFADLDQQPQPLTEDVFNRPLQQRVKLFQRHSDLKDDGVVGVNTLLRLNETIYPTKLLSDVVSLPPKAALAVTANPAQETH
ncbi:general secretion pathway protein A [Sinobacterium caligoides]|uniref:General secretion pathway protein A n=1 Tax=Sinobacterium caligoides TaxID=933926 RepID=A0A3N2E101_9GAMM|nr:AAA family ATPase [Sinobacterium caligoides]ROS05766.1 general secretion pathway protein A [Sinobacterium caligoides]